jgi:hypothetical protein
MSGIPLALASAINSGNTTGAATTYVDDVFASYIYTGNGSTQTINNGIDLAGKGGMVWGKNRTSAISNAIFDTARGVSHRVSSDLQSADQFTSGFDLTAFNGNGFSLGPDSAGGASGAGVNTSGSNYVSWTFRKAQKFFDVVTYTGDGVSNRQVPHSLGIVPGMWVVKQLNTARNWIVKHISLTTGNTLQLNTTGAEQPGSSLSGGATSTTFDVTGWNSTGDTFVAYLWAHDSSAVGMIQCGSYVGNGSSVGPVITLGWEPQYLLIKNKTTTANWAIFDVSRDMSIGGTPAFLYPNLSSAEDSSNITSGPITLIPTGFQITPSGTPANATTNSSGDTYIYMAIRRSNKTPTSGTAVYHAVSRTGTSVAATVTGVGFSPDLMIHKWRANGGSSETADFDRLRGRNLFFNMMSTGSESNIGTSTKDFVEFTRDGVNFGVNQQTTVNASGEVEINWFFKRAPGFFDQICFAGINGPGTISHGLNAVPELLIIKARNAGYPWSVWYTGISNAQALYLNTTAASANSAGGTPWNGAHTASVLNLGNDPYAGATTGVNFVAYMFASLAGISKVFTYTGNGSSQTISCGFSSGARFVLIKRTDNTGDWYVWDTVRGIVSGSEPHLSLNKTNAEVTDNSIDPVSSGFIVNQLSATNINVTSATYIGLAIA